MPFGGKPEKTNSKVLEFEETAFRAYFLFLSREEGITSREKH